MWLYFSCNILLLCKTEGEIQRLQNGVYLYEYPDEEDAKLRESATVPLPSNTVFSIDSSTQVHDSFIASCVALGLGDKLPTQTKDWFAFSKTTGRL